MNDVTCIWATVARGVRAVAVLGVCLWLLRWVWQSMRSGGRPGPGAISWWAAAAAAAALVGFVGLPALEDRWCPPVETPLPGPTATGTGIPVTTATGTPAPGPTATSMPVKTATGIPTRTVTPSVSATPAPSVGVLVVVSSPSVPVGQPVVVYVVADAVERLYAFDVRLSFDAGRLEVVDADGDVSNGVQVGAGEFMPQDQGFTLRNSADNEAGTVEYVFTLMRPALPVTGTGVLARITFRGKAEGVAAIRLRQVMLADDGARGIAVRLEDGEVRVVGGG